MRISTRSLLRTALGSWIAAAVLTATPTARGQADATPPSAQSATNPPATQPATMRFKRYVITDDQGFKGMEVFHGVMPVDWKIKGAVMWKMALKDPALIRIHWGDAQDVSTFDVYPNVAFTWQYRYRPGTRRLQPGQVDGGFIVQEPPTDQFDAFDKVIIKYFRPDLKDAKVVNKQKMPNVAKAIAAKLNTDPSWPVAVGVGRETLEYDLHGQTVQEVITGVVTMGGNQQMGFANWTVMQATSERAPKTSYDQLKPVDTIMMQSLQMNPAWSQKVVALMQQRYQRALANQRQQAANQQAQFNAIESRISSQTAADDAEHDQYWQHSADLQRQSDAEADVQREVSPWTASDGSTVKLPTTYGNAWQSTDGTIIMNNDNTYNPNADPNAGSTTWTQLQQTGGN